MEYGTCERHLDPILLTLMLLLMELFGLLGLLLAFCLRPLLHLLDLFLCLVLQGFEDLRDGSTEEFN